MEFGDRFIYLRQSTYWLLLLIFTTLSLSSGILGLLCFGVRVSFDALVCGEKRAEIKSDFTELSGFGCRKVGLEYLNIEASGGFNPLQLIVQ